MPTKRPLVPYYFIINRGYISAIQDIKNDIVLASNYLYPALNLNNEGVGTCPPSLSPPSVADESTTIATQTGTTSTYFWGIKVRETPNYTYTRTIPNGIKCINKIKPLDKNGSLLIIDQTVAPADTPANISRTIAAAAGTNPYTLFPLKNINDPIPFRNRNISENPEIAAPRAGYTYNTSTYFIRYTTDPVDGGFYAYDSTKPDQPNKLVPAKNGMIGPDDFVELNADPYSWHLIRNIWNIKSRDHPDQALIMDQINNIYIDRANLFMQVSVIFYAGYASKVLPTVEPFKSLLAGYPIDIIQEKTNVFRKGLIGTDIVVNSTESKTSPNATKSPYESLPTFPDIKFKSSIFDTNNTWYKIFKIEAKPADLQEIIVKKAYTLEKAIYVPIFKVIKTLWDECSKFDTSTPPKPLYPVVDNTGTNCESLIPDFAFITSYNQIIYRCYFWALNANNKSINGETKTKAYTNFIANLSAIGTGVKDFHETMLVDAAAYYKALYDNNYLLSGDRFGKPDNPRNSSGDFCVNKSPNTNDNSFITGGLSIDPVGYVFCALQASASDNISLVSPPPPDPPPPPPPLITPSIPPPPRISTLNDKQTFLCENRNVSRIYKYNQSTNTKIPYASAGIAITYTPSMTSGSLSDSLWVWNNSLDGVNLKCSQISNDMTISSIYCPNGQNCAPPPSETDNIPGTNVGGGDEGGEGDYEEGGEEAEDDQPKKAPASGPNNTALIISIVVVIFIVLILFAAAAAFYFFIIRKNAIKTEVPKLVKKTGGYFQYIIDE